jgi:small subunit ribosomal protein S13
MARIAGVQIPEDKQLQIALTYIYGIGPKIAGDIVDKANLDPTTRVKKLTDDETSKLQEIITNDYMIEGDLRKVTTANLKRLKDINAYRGLRHAASLPSRGQRTRTNARTRRGKKITVGGTAKKVAAKT